MQQIIIQIQFMHIYTSHLGDSGMKNSPGINTVQGKAPVIGNPDI